MVLLAFLLIPAILAAERETTINNYVVKISGDTLISVNLATTDTTTIAFSIDTTTTNATSYASGLLNLTGLGLRTLVENAFENSTTLVNLDLGNNLLSSIPKKLFSNLENLEYLSLANNNLSDFENIFEGLHNLKTLNISNNPLHNLKATALSGLPKTSIVFTNGLSLKIINAFVFDKQPGPTLSTYMLHKRSISNNQHLTRKAQEQDDSTEIKKRKTRDVNENRLIVVCLTEGVLKEATDLEQTAVVPRNCHQEELAIGRGKLNLEKIGIVSFENNWYQLDTITTILQIFLAGNNIQRVTPQLVNMLPVNVRYFDLKSNQIKRLEKDVLDNIYIRAMDLSLNAIRHIEDDVFMKMPSLSKLYLDDNLLNNTRFMATLPAQIEALFVRGNQITEITPRNSSTPLRLRGLYLNRNQIQELKADSFNGFPELVSLELSNNRISKINSESFQQLSNVNSIVLNNNRIVAFEIGTFENLQFLTRLDVSNNKLAIIKESFPDGLPRNLIVLKLGFNEIKKLENNDFKNEVMEYLTLSGNKISEIEHRALELPALKVLKLDENKLARLDSECFRRLHIKNLGLAFNNITTIPKGFTKNMPSLDDLDLSYNPIRRLENGALYGFRKTAYNNVIVSGVPIEMIEGGLFDDFQHIIQL